LAGAAQVRVLTRFVAGEYDAAMARGARCPTCRGEAAGTGNPHRPFCSLTCRLLDLGAWLDERYRIPGPPVESGPPAEARAGDEEARDVP
jgi:endogenous inhibitor of DNA gyrase (YacG/DUF329 family)